MTRLLERAWVPLVMVIVVAIAAFTVTRLAGQSVSAAAQHLGARPGKKRDKPPCSRRQPPIFGPYHPYLPVRPRVAQGDLGQRWVGMCRARQHRDTEAGPRQPAQGLVLFTLKR